MDIRIQEFKNGKFQVWIGNQVLRPCNHQLEGSHQATHDFMFFNTLKGAKTAIREYLRKEKGKELVCTHTFKEDEL